MTNFEVWKKNLTQKQALDLVMGYTGLAAEFGRHEEFDVECAACCPVLDVCQNNCGGMSKCGQWFMDWANAEAAPPTNFDRVTREGASFLAEFIANITFKTSNEVICGYMKTLGYDVPPDHEKDKEIIATMFNYALNWLESEDMSE